MGGKQGEERVMLVSPHMRQLMDQIDLSDSPIKKILQASVPDTPVRT